MARQGMAGPGAAGQGKARRGKVRQGFFFHRRSKMQFEKSADTKVLETVFREAKVGDLVTYAVMSKSLGRDVRVFAQGAINTARRTLLAGGVVFGTERNTGIIRLNDVQIIDSTEADRQRVQRIGNRSLKKLGTVRFESLDNDQKKRHTTMAAQLGAISMFASKSSTKKIESNVKPDSATLAIGETLGMFK